MHVLSSFSVAPMIDMGYGAGAGAIVNVDELLQSAERQLQTATAATFDRYPRVGYDFEVVATSPGSALVAAAEHADLVVVGSTGAGAVRRFLLGSTAAELLAACPCPVVVVPAERHGPNGRIVDPESTGRMVVGIDGSEHSARAVRWAVDEADRSSSRLVVLHAWEYPYAAEAPGAGRGNDLARVDAALVLQQSVEMARDLSVGEVVSELKAAGAADALIEASKHADLVIVGSRGRGGFRSMLFGSVAHAVSAASSCPVVVVR